MTETEFNALSTDTEAQLEAALHAVGAGEFIDLDDLLPRIDALCAEAIQRGNKQAAERLARILATLDRLQAALRTQIARQRAEARPDPKRASETYRAAARPNAPADEPK